MMGKVGEGVIAGNGGRYENPELDNLFSQDAQTIDPSARKAIWDQIQKIAMDELPWVPLFEFPNVQLAHANFHDVVTGALDYLGSFEDTYKS
jgi:peptide/nickel transport system substrate-binding protein